jgi:hypothetical protein
MIAICISIAFLPAKACFAVSISKRIAAQPKMSARLVNSSWRSASGGI